MLPGDIGDIIAEDINEAWFSQPKLTGHQLYPCIVMMKPAMKQTNGHPYYGRAPENGSPLVSFRPKARAIQADHVAYIQSRHYGMGRGHLIVGLGAGQGETRVSVHLPKSFGVGNNAFMNCRKTDVTGTPWYQKQLGLYQSGMNWYRERLRMYEEYQKEVSEREHRFDLEDADEEYAGLDMTDTFSDDTYNRQTVKPRQPSRPSTQAYLIQDKFKKLLTMNPANVAYVQIGKYKYRPTGIPGI